MNKKITLSVLLILLCIPYIALAGGPLTIINNQPVTYPDNGQPINLHYDQGTLGTRSKETADDIVNQAIILWNNVPTATVNLQQENNIPVDVTQNNFNDYLGRYADGINPIIYDSDGTIIDALFGTGARKSVLGFAGSAYKSSTGSFTEGQAIINGFISISNSRMTVVLAHEIGHMIGLDHAQLDSTQGLTSANYALMYPIAYRNSISLHEDEVSTVSELYPEANTSSQFAKLTGSFLDMSNQAILGANIWVKEFNTGKVYSKVSDYLKQKNGYFQLLLPPGQYSLHAESIQSNFTGGSRVGPYANSSSASSFQAPHPITPVSFNEINSTTAKLFSLQAGCEIDVSFHIDGSGFINKNGCVISNNKAPTAKEATFTIPQDLIFTDTLLATDSDNDTLSYLIVNQPSQGNLVITNNTSGEFTYTPNLNVTGTDHFSFQADDGKALSNEATITIVIETNNQSPNISSINATPSAINSQQTSQLIVNAEDSDNGPAALSYHWTVKDGEGTLSSASIKNPIYTAPIVTQTTTFNIRVEVFDGQTSTIQYVAITVTKNEPSSTALFNADFNDGSLTNWSIIDQGNTSGPSKWTVKDGMVYQSSNIYQFDPPAYLGTYLLYDNGSQWTDYQLSLTMKSQDDDFMGVMFRVQDGQNYYRFAWDKQRQIRRITKHENGVVTLLAEDTVPYVINQLYQLRVQASGPSMEVFIDNQSIFTATDDRFTSGSIALYQWGNQGGYFDNVEVISTDKSSSDNIPPVIDSVSASPNSITNEQTSLLSVIASDPDNQPSPLTYAWSLKAGEGQLNDVTSKNPTYTPPMVTSSQTFILTVEVSDGMYSASQDVSITVTQPSNSTLLLMETFNNENLSGWSVIDNGSQSTPSAWSVKDGMAYQSSNIYQFDPPAYLGSYLLYDNGSQWTNYLIKLSMKSLDDDAMGVMFRIQDDQNYYRFAWDKQRQIRRITKHENGVVTLLAEDTVPYVINQLYQLRVQASGPSMEVFIDNQSIFTATDDRFTSGSIALYQWGNQGGYFDNVEVISTDKSSSDNIPPVIDSVSASPNSITNEQTSLLSVIASDPDNQPSPLTYAWSLKAGEGQLNDVTSKNPTYTPPMVTSSQTFILTVEVSDGMYSASQDVSITVTQPSNSTLLLMETFNNENLSGWSVIDNGSQSTPSAWSVKDGMAYQSSNIYQFDPPAYLGSYLLYDNGSQWTNYLIKLSMKSLDDDAMGVMFRIQDDQNYYRFAWDKQRNIRRITKHENGTVTILAEDTVPYVINQFYQLRVQMVGSSMEVFIDDQSIFTATDDRFTSGSIALYQWGNQGGYFDNVEVIAQ